MTGWKTWVAFALGVVTALGKIFTALLADPFDANGLYQGLLMLAGAIGIVGIGHKIEKTSE